MTFANRDLQRLMQTPSTDLQESAEQANLCMEDRISATRQATYEAAVGSPSDWKAWQDRHRRYVREEVNRPRPLSAAFDKGSSWSGRTLFAVPTVLDQPMNNVFFPAPRSSEGLAVGLAPKHDCSHLAVEIIHARIDYQAHHWMRVDRVTERRLSQNDVRNLRKAHLSCLRRRSGAANYGKGCV